MRSFSDPETHFRLLTSETPVTVDGVALGAPTGEVECEECGRSAAAPEYIPHKEGCEQRDVRSEWWETTHRILTHETD